MARQKVRYIWSSFWFTHLGEYLPDEKEWMPYTYAKWWKLGQTMSDEKIRTFIRPMHEHGIGTYAYFNVTEYGGAGGKAATRPRRSGFSGSKFANALVKDAGRPGHPHLGRRDGDEPRQATTPCGPSSETRCAAISSACRRSTASSSTASIGPRLRLRPRRRPEHDRRPARGEHGRAGRRSRAMRSAVCRTRRASGCSSTSSIASRCSATWTASVTRTITCRRMGYLDPAAAGLGVAHARRTYQGDLLQFEGQLKRRLQWALFPQMIAHQFPISQQGPNARRPICWRSTRRCSKRSRARSRSSCRTASRSRGQRRESVRQRRRAIRGAGHFPDELSFAGPRACSPVTVALRVPDGSELTWAHVFSPETPPYRAAIAAARRRRPGDGQAPRQRLDDRSWAKEPNRRWRRKPWSRKSGC